MEIYLIMMRLFFELGDFMCNFIPGRKNREWFRRTQLYDYRKKLKSLKESSPGLSFKKIRLVKGGWNIGFIVDNKYVFKIRKYYDDKYAAEKIIREKRITDAFANIVPVKIPNIKIIKSGEYTFYMYEFIQGKNLNKCSLCEIRKHRVKLGKQIAAFIYSMHNSRPDSISDLAISSSSSSDGWNHNDLCNNIIVDPNTMDICGVIDWEYAEFAPLKKEFMNTIAYSSKMRHSCIIIEIVDKYYDMLLSNKKLKN